MSEPTMKETTRIEEHRRGPYVEQENLDAVERFKSWMLWKLGLNNDKDHWAMFSQKYLLKRLSEELKELRDAVRRNDHRSTQEEAADVANFAMMLSDNAQTLQCGGRIGTPHE